MTAGYLADACALIVFFSSREADRLMPRGTEIMRRERVRVSPITVWEITRKAALGKLPPVWGHYPSLSLLLRAQGFEPEPLTWDIAEQANLLPALHKDPMDRMLVATALRCDLTIITDDGIFADYGIQTLW
ncbi:MAG: type II toxin-antitoxin system VapC family toxin [Acetobacteraceae bacterium]|nr:type II toxin-antitoxin system VapC family toxin [Acetobacteraceae bacterium]